ncbi:MAG: hypothetical protein JXX28_15535 [Deltaproteobacteria bacterium]|nr:hypothetical protein [Deltaproteobacteria bacterium]
MRKIATGMTVGALTLGIGAWTVRTDLRVLSWEWRASSSLSEEELAQLEGCEPLAWAAALKVVSQRVEHRCGAEWGPEQLAQGLRRGDGSLSVQKARWLAGWWGDASRPLEVRVEAGLALERAGQGILSDLSLWVEAVSPEPVALLDAGWASPALEQRAAVRRWLDGQAWDPVRLGEWAALTTLGLTEDPLLQAEACAELAEYGLDGGGPVPGDCAVGLRHLWELSREDGPPPAAVGSGLALARARWRGDGVTLDQREALLGAWAGWVRAGDPHRLVAVVAHPAWELTDEAARGGGEVLGVLRHHRGTAWTSALAALELGERAEVAVQVFEYGEGALIRAGAGAALVGRCGELLPLPPAEEPLGAPVPRERVQVLAAREVAAGLQVARETEALTRLALWLEGADRVGSGGLRHALGVAVPTGPGAALGGMLGDRHPVGEPTWLARGCAGVGQGERSDAVEDAASSVTGAWR